MTTSGESESDDSEMGRLQGNILSYYEIKSLRVLEYNATLQQVTHSDSVLGKPQDICLPTVR